LRPSRRACCSHSRTPALASVSVPLVRQAFVLAYFRVPRAGRRLRAPGATHSHGPSVHEA
jgi:hypothetical protein